MASPRATHGLSGPRSLHIRWRPADFSLREAAEPVLRAAVLELGLAGVIEELQVWIDMTNRDDHAYIEWNMHDHRAARLSFAIGNFVTPARRRGWRRIWSRRAGAPPISMRQFSRRSFAEACLHELCHLKDDHESGIELAKYPEREREALNELWNVWIDGRLHRRGLPSMTRAERHSIYARTLSEAPGYPTRGERIFRVLWRADHLRPQELQSYLRELLGEGGTKPRRRGRRTS